MKTFIWITAAILLMHSSCKKDNKQNNDQKATISGPFSIYGEASCNGSSPLLLADYTYGEAGQKIVKSVHDNDHWNPEFFVMKAGGGNIVFAVQDYANDTTYWVWYEDENTVPCTFAQSGCKSIKLQAFKKLEDVTASKFIFKIAYDNPNGTLIESPGGWHLYYGEGKQRSNGLCNRLVGAFLAMSAPCKELFEGEKAWDYCFNTTWYFVK